MTTRLEQIRDEWASYRPDDAVPIRYAKMDVMWLLRAVDMLARALRTREQDDVIDAFIALEEEA